MPSLNTEIYLQNTMPSRPLGGSEHGSQEPMGRQAIARPFQSKQVVSERMLLHCWQLGNRVHLSWRGKGSMRLILPGICPYLHVV